MHRKFVSAIGDDGSKRSADPFNDHPIAKSRKIWILEGTKTFFRGLIASIRQHLALILVLCGFLFAGFFTLKDVAKLRSEVQLCKQNITVGLYYQMEVNNLKKELKTVKTEHEKASSEKHDLKAQIEKLKTEMKLKHCEGDVLKRLEESHVQHSKTAEENQSLKEQTKDALNRVQRLVDALHDAEKTQNVLTSEKKELIVKLKNLRDACTAAISRKSHTAGDELHIQTASGLSRGLDDETS